ncbi:RHS repeat domain-containing protein [Butyrivibrio fibrisolvens]|uniref:RHS repeat domain-containing protein n=1 Tax=Butyrivibrio fibrisolvens TaxID=831 RepID=UPI0020C14EAB|nr:RHS repeat-associated core domain-containing protein [Butyrivibrio fibrisolvens]
MTSFDKKGQLDRYFYSYNNTGLISGINRERRDLDAISGQYDYQYDEIGRLTRSSLNGELKASYEYDAFGNRTSLIESDTQTTYRYDALDRLVEAKELNNSQAIVRSYDYDKRGNQTNEYVDGLLNKTFTFDATNMLSKVIDSEKGELENQYNGLGFRVASIRPEERIEYLCDLSRDCYNMLERTVNGETESFIYDKNVISMSKAGDNYYYLQDELGSPMYMTGTDGAAVSSYAFDDFGRSINPFTGKIKEAGNKQHTKHAYTTEGNIIQPFAFTGYQEDEVSGLKFAQARFYSAYNGRFVGVDLKKGIIEFPSTLNQFSYCINDPYTFVDKNGQWLSLKDFNVSDALATAGMAVATTAAVAGGVILATATAPVSVPLIAAGAVVGAGVAYDASVISDWKNDEHANLQKAVDNATAGAMIGGTLVAGAGAVTAAGGASLETVGTAMLEHKDVVTGTFGGLISMAKGDSFSSGFWPTYVNSKVTTKFNGGVFGNLVGGIAGSATSELTNFSENGDKTFHVGKAFAKSATTGLVQSVLGGMGDAYGSVLEECGADTTTKLLWYGINDLKNQNLLGETASFVVEEITNNNACPSDNN